MEPVGEVGLFPRPLRKAANGEVRIGSLRFFRGFQHCRIDRFGEPVEEYGPLLFEERDPVPENFGMVDLFFHFMTW